MDEKKRKQENDRIIERMKRGESLATVPTEATWFPPRPTIKKDLTKLYTLSTPTKTKFPILVTGDNDNDDIKTH